jgi:hypothetical protein
MRFLKSLFTRRKTDNKRALYHRCLAVHLHFATNNGALNANR